MLIRPGISGSRSPCQRAGGFRAAVRGPDLSGFASPRARGLSRSGPCRWLRCCGLLERLRRRDGCRPAPTAPAHLQRVATGQRCRVDRGGQPHPVGALTSCSCSKGRGWSSRGARWADSTLNWLTTPPRRARCGTHTGTWPCCSAPRNSVEQANHPANTSRALTRCFQLMRCNPAGGPESHRSGRVPRPTRSASPRRPSARRADRRPAATSLERRGIAPRQTDAPLVPGD